MEATSQPKSVQTRWQTPKPMLQLCDNADNSSQKYTVLPKLQSHQQCRQPCCSSQPSAQPIAFNYMKAVRHCEHDYFLVIDGDNYCMLCERWATSQHTSHKLHREDVSKYHRKMSSLALSADACLAKIKWTKYQKYKQCRKALPIAKSVDRASYINLDADGYEMCSICKTSI